MFLTKALINLRPGAKFNCSFTDDSNVPTKLEWLSPELSVPTQEEIDIEVARLKAEHDAKDYQRLRSLEYPPMTDYLDAVVKGDQAQMQAYIDACLAVKEKYPKPEGT
jgi:hypothetical protein